MMSSHNIFGVWILIITIIITVAAAVADTSIKPKLTVDPYTLDVDDLDATTYTQFLERLRKALTDNKDPPVLPQATTPPQYFELKLYAYGTKETTVMIQKNNLYVIGYQALTPEKKWFELGYTTEKKHKIDGSVFLNYQGDYLSLERAANRSITDITLTQYAFSQAVSTLSSSTDPKKSTVVENQKRARALITVIVMVSEACRLIDISNFLSSNLFSSDTHLTDCMFKDLVKSWDKYSGYVLSPKTFKKVTICGEEIKGVEKLREILGVILNTKKSVKQPAKIGDELSTIIDVQAQLNDAEPLVLEA